MHTLYLLCNCFFKRLLVLWSAQPRIATFLRVRIRVSSGLRRGALWNQHRPAAVLITFTLYLPWRISALIDLKFWISSCRLLLFTWTRRKMNYLFGVIGGQQTGPQPTGAETVSFISVYDDLFSQSQWVFVLMEKSMSVINAVYLIMISDSIPLHCTDMHCRK